jgi:hypothetical protein
MKDNFSPRFKETSPTPLSSTSSPHIDPDLEEMNFNFNFDNTLLNVKFF